MQCKNHPESPAVDRCAGCAEPFCADCLVEMQGARYCGSCKVMALQGRPPAIEPSLPCKEAGEALTYSIVGLFCFGIILEPIAIVKAVQAKKAMSMNPNLSGSGKANAALIIAIIGLVLWVIGLLSRFASI